MLDKSIDGALLALRKQIIRGDGEGLDHVEGLLRLRGVPMPRVLPPKRADVRRKGETRRRIAEALRRGAVTRREIALAVYGNDGPKERDRISQALYKMKLAGLSVQAAHCQ